MKTTFTRRILLILLALITLFTFKPLAVSATNSKVDLLTLAKLKQFILGIRDLSGEEIIEVDVNNDNQINIFDVIITKQILLYGSEEEQTVEQQLKEFNLSSILSQLTLKQESLTDLDDYYEYSDIYTFSYKNIPYCFRLLYTEKPEITSKSLILEPTKIKGIHVWKYEGTEDTSKFLDPTKTIDLAPDKTSFEDGDNIVEYDLKPVSGIDKTMVEEVVKIVSGAKNLDKYTRAYCIQRFDFNKDEVIDLNDLKIITSYYLSNPGNFTINSRGAKMLTPVFKQQMITVHDFGINEWIWTDSTEIIPYSLVLPYSSFTSPHTLFQVLPSSYYSLLHDNYSNNIEDEFNFLIWRPSIKGYDTDGSIKWFGINDASTKWKYYPSVILPLQNGKVCQSLLLEENFPYIK